MEPAGTTVEVDTGKLAVVSAQSFRGDQRAIRWSVRDIASLKAVLRLVPGRTACVQAGANLGVLSAFDYTIVTGPTPAVVPDPNSTRQLIAQRRGEMTVTFAFPRGLWAKPTEPPSAVLRVVVN